MITAHYATVTAARTPRWLALAAVAGPVLFTLAWLILGFLSPGYPLWDMWIGPYSPISQPISGLGMGVTAPFMNAAFVLNGLLLIIGVFAIFHNIHELTPSARWTHIILLSLPGLGSILDGLFTLESFFLHFVGFALVLTTILTFPLTGRLLRQLPHWRPFANYLLLSGPITLALSILYFATFNPEAAGLGIGISGLIQRLLILQILTCYATLGWLSFSRS
jgi:hypothetical protein